MTQMELDMWVYGVLHAEPTAAGAFLTLLAQAASHADTDNYNILRPVLQQMAEKYPKYCCSCAISGKGV